MTSHYDTNTGKYNQKILGTQAFLKGELEQDLPDAPVMQKGYTALKIPTAVDVPVNQSTSDRKPKRSKRGRGKLNASHVLQTRPN